ncbi:MAG TPA: hypothetical protein VM124_01605 [Candidatus Limnocylindrales bacterium]|nr:hypothetical protein [Candidatus Limnocylindrales bacterium]
MLKQKANNQMTYKTLELLEPLPIETVVSEFVDPAIRFTGARNELNTVTMTAINLAGACYTGRLDPFGPDFRTHALAYLREQEDGGDSFNFARHVYSFELDDYDVIMNACRMAHEAFVEVPVRG